MCHGCRGMWQGGAAASGGAGRGRRAVGGEGGSGGGESPSPRQQLSLVLPRALRGAEQGEHRGLQFYDMLNNN